MLRLRRLFTYKQMNFMQQESEWSNVEHSTRPLNVHVHDKNTLTELICYQSHPAILMQIYEQHQFDMDHIILTLKISMQFVNEMRNLKSKELTLFQKMTSQLDVKKLTLIDLRDLLQCQAKFKIMKVPVMKDLDKNLILNAIKANIDQFELRNQVNIYYHAQQLQLNTDSILNAIIKQIHLANSVEINVIMKVEFFKQQRSTKIIEWGILKKIAHRIEELIDVLDADQLATLYAYFTQLELHYHTDYLQPLPIIFILAHALLTKLDQLDTVNILQIIQCQRHQQKNFPDFLQKKIKKLLFQAIDRDSVNLSLPFLMSLLEHQQQVKFFTDEEDTIIQKSVVDKITKGMENNPTISDVSLYARYLLFLEIKMDGFQDYAETMNISILNYLRFIHKMNLDNLIQVQDRNLIHAYYQLLNDCDLKKELYKQMFLQHPLSNTSQIVNLEYIDEQSIRLLEEAANGIASYDYLVKNASVISKSMISNKIVEIWKSRMRQEDILWLTNRYMAYPTPYHMDFLMNSFNRSVNRLSPTVILQTIIFSPMVALHISQELINKILERFRQHSQCVRLTMVLFQYLKNQDVDYWRYRIPYRINSNTLEEMYPFVDDDCKLIILYLIFINP